ncbi:MAG: endolytic transglycosylase MltG [Ginsengibacter sp.]
MKIKGRLILVFFIAIMIAAGFIGWQLFGPTINTPRGNFFYIKTGSTYQNVKDNLTHENIVNNIGVFDRVSEYLNYNRTVKPGKYKITEGMNLINLIRMLRSGNQTPVNLVITKLRTKEDLAKKIGDNFESDLPAVTQFINNPDSLSQYNLDTNTVLTAVIPNTYTFTWNTTPSKIFKRLYAEQQKFWNPRREAAAAALGLGKKQAYILASIVQEESNKREDKEKIASVYINRMRIGMKLAADPTIKFAMKNFGLKRIYFKHLSYPSAYNTYLNPGLPPGPICTPSIQTIDAVLNAPATDYLFFVAKPDFSGYSNFANTYEEHKRNAKAYQQALDSIIILKQNSN